MATTALDFKKLDALHLQSVTEVALDDVDALAEFFLANDKVRAAHRADMLKDSLVAQTEDVRAQVLEAIRARIETKPEEIQGVLFELCGLKPTEAERRTESQLLREQLIDDLLKQAAEEAGLERDETILQAVRQLAGMTQLVILRKRADFEPLGIDGKTFDRLIAKAKKESTEIRRAEVVDGRLMYEGFSLGNFQAHITHQLTLDDGMNTPATRYTLTGQLADGRKLRTQEVPADEYDACKWVQRWGARVMLDIPPKNVWQVARAVKEISQDKLKEETIYQFSGWAKLNGSMAFLSTSGAITVDGHKPDVRVDMDGNLRHYRLPAPPAKPKAAIEESLRFLDLAPDNVTVPLWLAMYAAPLTYFKSLDAMLWVYGQTQSRKSTLTLLALTHFGQKFVEGTKFRAPMDWLSTFTALEGALFTTKDLPLVIDDYTPQATEDGRRRLLKTAQDVIRTVGNRSTRGRASGDLSMRAPRPPRGVAIATSEKELEVQSTVGRMVYVPIQRGDVQTASDGQSLLDQAQHTNGEGGPGLYAQAMAAYVQFIAREWGSVEALCTKSYDDYNTQARSIFTSTQGRMLDIYALFMMAGEITLNAFVDMDALSNRRADELTKRLQSGLVTVLQKHTRHVTAQSPARRLFDALQVLFAQGKAYLAPRTADDLGKEFYAPDRAVKLGYFEPSEPVVYLMVDPAIQAAKEFYQKTGESFDTLPHAFNGDCRTAGLLKKTSEDRATVKTHTRDGSLWLLMIDAEKLYKEFDVWLWKKDQEPPRKDTAK